MEVSAQAVVASKPATSFLITLDEGGFKTVYDYLAPISDSEEIHKLWLAMDSLLKQREA